MSSLLCAMKSGPKVAVSARSLPHTEAADAHTEAANNKRTSEEAAPIDNPWGVLEWATSRGWSDFHAVSKWQTPS